MKGSGLKGTGLPTSKSHPGFTNGDTTFNTPPASPENKKGKVDGLLKKIKDKIIK